ncbi:MAG TPA: cell division protein FtsQ/DivIB [Solirubrobacterales bacterium]|nr:cell division protein FtsQ/DivIB [Solirubrobacterales bacterium]
MRRQLAARKRLLLGGAGAVFLVVVLYLVFVRDSTTEPHLVSSQPVAAIGSGDGAVAVAEDGTVLAWFPSGANVDLAELPIDSPPKGDRVQGSVLEQVHVLAAAPAALRPYLASSRFGESGVEVELTSGIELIFGNAAAAKRKWHAAAAVLADPEITALDYVDLRAPGRPSVGGSGHTLPPPP